MVMSQSSCWVFVLLGVIQPQGTLGLCKALLEASVTVDISIKSMIALPCIAILTRSQLKEQSILMIRNTPETLRPVLARVSEALGGAWHKLTFIRTPMHAVHTWMGSFSHIKVHPASGSVSLSCSALPASSTCCNASRSLDFVVPVLIPEQITCNWNTTAVLFSHSPIEQVAATCPQVPAKAAARMGQALSTTQRTIHVAQGEDRTIDDVERGGYCFTDGAGQISLQLLKDALKEMDERRRRRRAVPWTPDNVSALQVSG
jgi:hypothetical protein